MVSGYGVTKTGKLFRPWHMLEDMINVEDIAHALSLTCRYGGHCGQFYSVAMHSLNLSWWFDTTPAKAQWALLHDAAEAYIGDLIHPLKHNAPDIQALDDRITGLIAQKFGLPGNRIPPGVKLADSAIVWDEMACLFSPDAYAIFEENLEKVVPTKGLGIIDLRIDQNPTETCRLFLQRYEELFT